MLSYLQKLLKEMVPRRCKKKETMSEVYKNNEKDIIYSLFRERVKGHSKEDKNQANEQKIDSNSEIHQWFLRS